MDIDVNAKTYLPKPPGIPVGTGSKKREHDVRGHWNVSHKTGNTNCRGICHPTRITDKRIKCVKCGKKSWLTDAHKRGDASLGVITHEYQALVS